MVDAIYHSCAGKSASSFFRELYNHSIVKKRFKINHYNVDVPFKKINILPNGALYHSMFIDYNDFINKPKQSENYKCFHIQRDPREIVVSSFYSWKYTHPGGHYFRKEIINISKDDGLKYTINKLKKEIKLFDIFRSWANVKNSEKFLVIKFEDFFYNDDTQFLFLKKMFEFFELGLTDDELNTLNDAFSYKKLSNGRKRGDVNNNSHYRSGIADSWKTEMSEDVLNYFYEQSGDLINILKY